MASGRLVQLAGMVGALAMVTMMCVSRNAGATMGAQLTRGLVAGLSFGGAVIAAVTVIRWLGEPSSADTDDADTDVADADAVVSAEIAVAAAVQPAHDASMASDGSFTPLVVPRLTADAATAPAAGAGDD